MLALLYQGRGETLPEQQNPAELRSALIFGALYAVLVFVSAAAKEHFGEDALYAVALVSGMVDVDAITLSTARMTASGAIETGTSWRLILLASLANLLFKAAAVLALGSWRLFARTLPVLLAGIAAGAALLAWWP